MAVHYCKNGACLNFVHPYDDYCSESCVRQASEEAWRDRDRRW